MTSKRDANAVIPPVPNGSVVVGIDGSDHSRTAWEWAADYAVRTGRNLALLHAADAPEAMARAAYVYGGVDPERVVDNALAAAKEDCRATREQVIERYPELAVSEHFSRGDARSALLEAASVASLLAVGSRGRGTVARLLLGSVGVAVCRHSPAPVLVTRPGANPENGRPIVVGVDATPDSRPLIEAAFTMADTYGSPLVVMHTHADQLALAYGLPSMNAPDDAEDSKRVVAEAVAGYSEQWPDVKVSNEVRALMPADALLDVGHDAAMLVVGRRHGPGLRGTLHHSVSIEVVERAKVPVFVVPID